MITIECSGAEPSIQTAFYSAGGEILRCSNCEESMKTCVQVYFMPQKRKYELPAKNAKMKIAVFLLQNFL